MEHTKGDWQVTRGSHSYPLEITTETKTIAQIETRWTMAELDANARLIAAAPDLLALCESVIAHEFPLLLGFAKMDDRTEAIKTIQNRIKEFEVAIAKVKGN